MEVLRKLPDKSIDMIYGDPDYNVGIDYAGKNYTIKGEKFEGSDEEYKEYLVSVLPTEEDEHKLMNDYMKQEWIQYREWKGK